MNILVTGFDPFGEDLINPSIEVVKRLPDTISCARIIKLEIPTIAYESIHKIEEVLRKEKPDIVLSIGQAGGSSEIRVERIGINVNDYCICDNGGNQYINTPIYDDGPDAYFSNLPIYGMVQSLHKANIPASISNSAGTFVCNHVLYGTRYLLEHLGLDYVTKSGFIHIPYLPQQVEGIEGVASMCLEDMLKAIEIAILAIVDDTNCMDTSEGSLC